MTTTRRPELDSASGRPPEAAAQVGVDVLLADGRIATIRPITPEDHDAVLALHEAVGDDNLRLRFFSANRVAARGYAERLAAADRAAPALAAYVDGRLIAVAGAEDARPGTAEVSFLVADEAHGLGLGTLLLEHLAAAGRDHGIRRFTADVLSENTGMLRVFADCGFDVRRQADREVVSLELDLTVTGRAVAAADAREATAEARSLAPLLYPRSVAVVGVRREGGGIGRAVLDSIRSDGFAGDLYIVHPGAREDAGLARRFDDDTDGVQVVPSFASLDRPVDLAVVAVPAARVLDVVREAAEAGVRGAVILSSGLGEVGEEGARLQRELVDVARRHSMRLIGPNCLGLLCNDPEVRLNATFSTAAVRRGGVAIASQSGGVGIMLLDLARESGLGVQSFVSLGNKADVSGNDLLCAWIDDGRVEAAALYLESFGNARKFARLARRFAERKPLLAVVGGRSDGGRRAGVSHTAAAAAPAVGVDALFAQAGVIGCPGLEELADTARLVTGQALPAGPRLGIVGNAGGLGVLAADAATANGLVVPHLSPELSERIVHAVDSPAGVSNPIDLGAGAGADGMRSAVTTLLASSEVDAVLLIVAGTTAATPGLCLDDLAARDLDTDKPLLVVPCGGVQVPRGPGLISFRSVDDAAGALARVTTYAAWRAAATASPRQPTVAGGPAVADSDRARSRARLLLGGGPGGGWVGFESARELLSCYGVALPGTVVAGGSAAVRAADSLGYPVVVKAAAPDVVHKTERGLVRTGLMGSSEVARAVTGFAVELATTRPAVLVQPQAAPGVEVAVGLVRDPGFGPLVMVAAGGVATDVWDDRVFLMPPLTAADATRAVRSLRIWPLLAGFRGSPATDVARLEELVLAVGRLAQDVPEVAELDLNPVIVGTSGLAVVDVKVRLASGAADDVGVPRQLRRPV